MQKGENVITEEKLKAIEKWGQLVREAKNNNAPIYTIDWLQLAIKNQLKDEMIPRINSNMTIQEYIEKWCKYELANVIKMSD